MKQKKWKKILGITLCCIFALAIIIIGGAAFIFRYELLTMNSIQKVDDKALYVMDYKGDYGLDEFLDTGASNDGELINFITKRLLKGLPLDFSVPDFGCSTFNAQTEAGDQIFGRNFDLTYSPALFVETSPKDGYRSFSTVNLAFLGYNEENLPDTFMQQVISLAAPYLPLDGMNEMGVSIGVLLIPDTPTNQETVKIDITTTTAIRLVLDKAATVAEAIALLEQYDMHSSAGSSYHFQISDAEGNSAVIEYVDNVFTVIKAEKNYQMATNFLLSDKKYNYGLGQDRYQILENILNEHGGILKDENAGMALLEAAAMELNPSEADPMETQWSVIYNNSDLTAILITAKQYDKPAHEFNLNEN